VLTALSGCLIEVVTDILASLRFGVCTDMPIHTEAKCHTSHWSSWESGFMGSAFIVNLCVGSLLAAISAFLVKRFAPAAAGSGIPETKVILNGFALPDSMSLPTLCVKIPGLALAVAAGMALGKEGPLVHVAVCWAKLLSRMFAQYRNENKLRELISAAAAAGVSTAFGAPIGGVLFSLEEVSSSFPSRTLIRSFTAAVAAALTLQIVDLHGTKRLTIFSVDFTSTIDPLEMVVFALLGIGGGFVGAAFNALNIHWSKIRSSHNFWAHKQPIIEVACIAAVTLMTSWPLFMTRVLSADAIHAMFQSCDAQSADYHKALCRNHDGIDGVNLWVLFFAATVRFLQMSLTFGSPCPAGLFVPSLYVGACLGRAVGLIMQALNMQHHFVDNPIEPGVYAMVGAGAVLGGVCRVTISLTVIMLELTGSLTYVVPFMISILLAKLVGDSLNTAIYDWYIMVKGYPFLHAEVEFAHSELCYDVMDADLKTIDVGSRLSLEQIVNTLQLFRYRGFPVVNGQHFIGYIRREELNNLIENIKAQAETGLGGVVGTEDIMPYTDCSVIRMVPWALLSQAHIVFKQLLVQHIFLVGPLMPGDVNDHDVLQGMISKKNFIRLMSKRSMKRSTMSSRSNFQNFDEFNHSSSPVGDHV